jgi:hypothetical protein
MGQEPIIDKNGNITNLLVSKYSPILKILNYTMPGAPSSTAYHDTGIDSMGGDLVDGTTKAITIPSYFLYNYYGAIGTPINSVKSGVDNNE